MEMLEKTSKTTSNTAILLPVKAIFEKRVTFIFPVFTVISLQEGVGWEMYEQRHSMRTRKQQKCAIFVRNSLKRDARL